MTSCNVCPHRRGNSTMNIVTIMQYVMLAGAVFKEAKSQTNSQITALDSVQEVTENNLYILKETSDNLHIMYTFSGISILLVLMSLLNGISGHPIGERIRSARTPAHDQNPVVIQTVTHGPNECTPARQAERDNTHDIACLLDVLEPFYTSLWQRDTPLDCSISPAHKFPELYRALAETLSQFESTNLATNFGEAVCMLKNVVQPGLNTTVRNYCNCATNEESCSSYQPSETSSGSNNEECLLLSLHSTLRNLQTLLIIDGQHVTCRRASGTQKGALLTFNESIHDYYNTFVTPEIFETQLPRNSCGYMGHNMTDHVQSLYTLVSPLSNLTSYEAQVISGNLSEVILPIIKPIVDMTFGEGFFEHAVNSSTPLPSVSTLNERERTVCFVNRLRITYSYFMDVLRDRDIITRSDSCYQYSS